MLLLSGFLAPGEHQEWQRHAIVGEQHAKPKAAKQ
jgi:hypothetical protein